MYSTYHTYEYAHGCASFRAFRVYSGLTSGVGVQYDQSIITVGDKNKTKIIVGERFPPQVVLQAADMKPVEIQDLCLSDTRFKIFIFTGDLLSEIRLRNVKTLARNLKGESGALCSFDADIFDIITVLKGTKNTVDYLAVPSALRASWHK